MLSVVSPWNGPLLQHHPACHFLSSVCRGLGPSVRLFQLNSDLHKGL